MLAEIASSVPIPPNIDIVVRLLLLLVTSKNEINSTNKILTLTKLPAVSKTLVCIFQTKTNK